MTTTDRARGIDGELARLDHERQRLMKAIAAGRTVTGVLEALEALEHRRLALEAERAAITRPRRVQAMEAARVRRDLMALRAPGAASSLRIRRTPDRLSLRCLPVGTESSHGSGRSTRCARLPERLRVRA
jgi:hypothetical protein